MQNGVFMVIRQMAFSYREEEMKEWGEKGIGEGGKAVDQVADGGVCIE